MTNADYNVVNGTSYHKDTPQALIEVLERAREQGLRLRLFVGDSATGRDWCEENDVTGTLGRSMGTIKVPLLLHNARSIGGGALLDHCIVRVLHGKRELYRHPSYHLPEMRVTPINETETCGKVNLRQAGYTHGVDRKNTAEKWETHIANFKSEAKAKRWLAFLKGERLNW